VKKKKCLQRVLFRERAIITRRRCNQRRDQREKENERERDARARCRSVFFVRVILAHTHKERERERKAINHILIYKEESIYIRSSLLGGRFDHETLRPRERLIA